MSTADLIYTKAKTLPDSAQAALLQLVELLAKEPAVEPPQSGNATAIILARSLRRG